ncbi:MAG: efflux RND transporter periplasmic adaptor subunit [Methylobacter sp.]
MNRQLIITAVLMLVLGAGLGYLLASKPEPVNKEQTRAVLPEEKKPLFYRSPMNPTVTSPVPAKDEMGMDYVPVYAEDNADDNETAGTVKIDAVTVQNMGVRTATAKKSILSHTVRAVGRVAYDEEHIVRLHPKTEGWIETLRVNKTGQWVKKDEDLLSIYSPHHVASLQEYLLALNGLKILQNSPIEDVRRGAEELVKSSRERLHLLDIPAHQLHDLSNIDSLKKGLHIHSPTNGIVMQIGAREGQYVTSETELYMIADLSKVWVYADVYEYELPWVKVGDPVEMQLAAVPGRIFHGHLAFIYPYAEAKTRTIKVRLVFDNAQLLLKPELFADVTIYAGKQVDAVVIPSEAVIRSGAKSQVFVVRGAGKFEPRQITTGLASSNEIAVLEGLKEGEEVVTSAQFLIDSESRLREATAKMMEPSTPQQSEPNRLIMEQGEHQHD